MVLAAEGSEVLGMMPLMNLQMSCNIYVPKIVFLEMYHVCSSFSLEIKLINNRKLPYRQRMSPPTSAATIPTDITHPTAAIIDYRIPLISMTNFNLWLQPIFDYCIPLHFSFELRFVNNICFCQFSVCSHNNESLDVVFRTFLPIFLILSNRFHALAKQSGVRRKMRRWGVEKNCAA